MDFILRLDELADAERRSRFRGALGKLEPTVEWVEFDVPVLGIVATGEPGTEAAVERMRSFSTRSTQKAEAYFSVGPIDCRDWPATFWPDFLLLAPHAYDGRVVGSGFVGDFADSADHILLSTDASFLDEAGLSDDFVPRRPRRRRLWPRRKQDAATQP